MSCLNVCVNVCSALLSLFFFNTFWKLEEAVPELNVIRANFSSFFGLKEDVRLRNEGDDVPFPKQPHHYELFLKGAPSYFVFDCNEALLGMNSPTVEI